jgi:L-lactate dehydrogenase complex protein LldG
MNSRDMVLARLTDRLNAHSTGESRRGNVHVRIADHPANTIPGRGQVPAKERVQLFETMLSQVHGTVAGINSSADIPRAIYDYLKTNNLGTEICLSPDIADLELDWLLVPGLKVGQWQARQSIEVGITGCYGAVAETGSLVVCSSAIHAITMNFLAETNIVILRVCDIVGVYEEIWTRMRQETSSRMPRDLTLISSPSCTGDIEMILEYGAHGPKNLHVIILE